MTHPSRPRVLVCYSRVGGGHLSAARALAAALEETGQAEARLADVYAEWGRFPVSRFPQMYARVSSRYPRAWSEMYYRSQRAGPWLDATWVLRPFLARGVDRLLAASEPDVVVSVLPLINGILAERRHIVQTRPRLEVVLTDWNDVHRGWVARGVDQYTAPTDKAGIDCVRHGARTEQVEVVGLPVRSEFDAPPLAPADVARVRREVGIEPDRFTILVMVGAEGSQRAVDNLRMLVAQPLDAQVLVMCGRNEVLRQTAERMPARLPVRAVGFRENVSELMRAADLLVTKAGGVTLAEAFCTGVPVVVHDLLPGQETGNVEYAREHGAVEYGDTPEALWRIVEGLRDDTARREALAKRGRALGRPHAARQIARNVLDRWGRTNGA